MVTNDLLEHTEECLSKEKTLNTTNPEITRDSVWEHGSCDALQMTHRCFVHLAVVNSIKLAFEHIFMHDCFMGGSVLGPARGNLKRGPESLRFIWKQVQTWGKDTVSAPERDLTHFRPCHPSSWQKCGYETVSYPVQLGERGTSRGIALGHSWVSCFSPVSALDMAMWLQWDKEADTLGDIWERIFHS